MKYMTNPYTKAAFREFRQLTDKIFLHASMPPIAKIIYGKVVRFLVTLGQASPAAPPVARQQ
jgi:hypothetical protein